MLNVKKTEYVSYAPRNNVNVGNRDAAILPHLPCLVSHGDLYSEKPLMLLNSFQSSARI